MVEITETTVTGVPLAFSSARFSGRSPCVAAMDVSGYCVGGRIWYTPVGVMVGAFVLSECCFSLAKKLEFRLCLRFLFWLVDAFPGVVYKTQY